MDKKMIGWIAVYSWIGAFVAFEKHKRLMGGCLVALGGYFGGVEITFLITDRILMDSISLFSKWDML